MSPAGNTPALPSDLLHGLAFALLAWAVLWGVALAGTVKNLPFKLVPAFADLQPLALAPAEQQWLATHPRLRVGIAIDDYQPIDITRDRNRYQGISADYLSLVGERLDVTMEVLGFSEREQAVERAQQPGQVAAVQGTQARAVDRHHAQAARLLGAAEQAVATLEQFTQIQLQAAAHGAHHVRLQFGVDEVLEVRQTVLGCHVEQPLCVLALPGEVLGDVVGGDGEGEHPALGVARGHHIDIGAVDEVHLGLQVAVRKGHLLPGDHGHLLAQVLGTGPVEGEVGERRLRAPARGHVEVVDQLLDALVHSGVVHGVNAHKRRHVGIER